MAMMLSAAQGQEQAKKKQPEMPKAGLLLGNGGQGLIGNMIDPTFPGGGMVPGANITPDMLVALRSMMGAGMGGGMPMAGGLISAIPNATVPPGMNGNLINAYAGQLVPGQQMAMPPALIAQAMGMAQGMGGMVPQGGPVLGNWLPQIMATQNMAPGTPQASYDIPAPTTAPVPGMNTATGTSTPPAPTQTAPSRSGPRSGSGGRERSPELMQKFQAMFGPEKANLLGNAIQALQAFRQSGAGFSPLLMTMGGNNGQGTGGTTPPASGNG